MSPTRLLPAALLAVIVPLAGCAAGQHDTTSQERTTPYTAGANVGALLVRNVFIAPAAEISSASSPSSAASESPSSSPTPTDSSSASASPSASSSASSSASPSSSSSADSSAAPAPQAYLGLTVVSPVPDRLVGASVAGGGTVTPSSGADFTVHPQKLLMVTDPQASVTGSEPSLAITGLPQTPQIGTTLAVTLTFEKAGTVTIQAPVRGVVAA